VILSGIRAADSWSRSSSSLMPPILPAWLPGLPTGLRPRG